MRIINLVRTVFSIKDGLLRPGFVCQSAPGAIWLSGWGNKWCLRCAWLDSGLGNVGKSRASMQELLTHSGLARPSIDGPCLEGTQGPLHQHIVWWWNITLVPNSSSGSFGLQVEDSPAQTISGHHQTCHAGGCCMQQEVLECLPHVPGVKRTGHQWWIYQSWCSLAGAHRAAQYWAVHASPS